MRNLLHCYRGSAAFVTVVALVPLIGAVALGGEAGSWYVTKQHAQSAADAAAVAGAWRLAWQKSDSVAVAKNFATKNGFCDACTPSPNTSQSVSVDSPDSQSVHVTVQQQQPAYLAAVLGFTTINIAAQATALVDRLPKPPCILALAGSVGFQGSATVNSSTCGLASNSTASNAIDFKGNGGSINAPSFTPGGCSDTGGNQCSATGTSAVHTHAPNVPDPLAALDSAMKLLKTTDFPKGKCTGPGLPKSYGTGQCYNDGNVSLSGTLSGTYYFNGNVSIKANTTVSSGTGGATLMLFGNAASFGMNGNPTITLTAPTSAQVPPALASVSNLMKDLIIYDPETTSVKINGSANSIFNGTIYMPKSDLTFTGNSALSTGGCTIIIAKSVQFSGNTKLDNSSCSNGKGGPFNVPYVRLVQ